MDQTLCEPETDIPDPVVNVAIPLGDGLQRNQAKQGTWTPLQVELKPGAQTVRVDQYPIRLEACEGLEPLINTAMQYGLLGEYQSELNTPILPAKNLHSQEYGLVQSEG